MADFYKLFLVGRTGNGKSSTGNSIIPGKLFLLTSNTVIKHSGVVNGINVEVVDGTGIGDVAEDLNGDMKTLVLNVESMFYNNLSCSFTALVLVLKFGTRFTNQEKESVRIVKSMFGENVFRKCGIILMTYGDNYNKEESGRFDVWIRNQSGNIKTLMEECDYRCVLFNNKTRNNSKVTKQVYKLMSAVALVQYTPYTARDFENAKRSRQRLKDSKPTQNDGDYGYNTNMTDEQMLIPTVARCSKRKALIIALIVVVGLIILITVLAVKLSEK